MRTSKEVITLGSKDPEMISLMGFFEENVGPDTISDFTTRVIIEQLASITGNFCAAHAIPLVANPVLPNHPLPTVVDKSGNAKFIVLVPNDIVRELPIANDWSDIEAAVNHNANIRQAVNAMLAGIAQPTVTDRKEALRAIALQSPQNFQQFLEAVKEHVRTYDPNVDALAYYRMKAIFASGFDGLKAGTAYDLSKGPGEIARLVHDTIAFFKQHVENGNLWEELWIEEKPKKERAAQLIYYAIADAYCHANNVDISPEANMGGGPIDFKFSQGYQSRVLVEMKRSSGTVRHGYEKQLEIYLDASRSQYGIFVVMDFGDLGKKLEQITEIQANRRAMGGRASDIVVIDATRKASASKRH
jgi:quinol monooxygenase YgiN